MTEHNQPSYLPSSNPEEDKKEFKQMVILFGVVVVVIGIVIVSGFAFQNFFDNSPAELSQMEVVVDGFLQSIADKDTESSSAYLTN